MMVDDEGTTLEVMQAFLEDAGYQRFVLVENSSKAMANLEKLRPDILLLDLMMPEVTGFEILQQVRAHDHLSHLPVIILTSSSDAETKLKALDYGATDFLAKPVDPSELILRVRNTLAAKAYQNQLAYYDGLTKLPNRNLFLDRLTWFLERAERHQEYLAMLHISLPHFKNINSTFGPQIGDQVIMQIADRIQTCIRGSDALGQGFGQEEDFTCVFRVSGDEFSVVCPNITHPENAVKVGARIIQIMQQPFDAQGTQVSLPPSIGIASYPNDATDVMSLIQCAVGASAQANAQTGYKFYSSEMNTKGQQRLQLEAELRQAIESDQLVLHYQPQVNIRSNQIKGVEALVRWQKPDGSFVFPDQFIPLAEETGLILPLGEWVLKEACSQWARWQAQGVTIQISVNLSLKQFHANNLVQMVTDTLASHRMDAQYLMLELTESLVMEHPEQALETLNQLITLGVKLSIDDFGTGYSSLSYLKQLPLHELKIDRSFLEGMTEDLENRALISAMIYLGHEFNLKVVAEGVEEKEQLEMLLGLECDEYQGYFFSRPIPADDLTAMLINIPVGINT